jgi:DNA-binding NtrC family response regulator
MLIASPGSSMEYLAKSIVEAGFPVEALFSAVLEQAVRSTEGNFTHAARRVGLSRAQLAYRVKTNRHELRRRS